MRVKTDLWSRNSGSSPRKNDSDDARRNRVVGPSAIAFKDCGRILATLFRQDGGPYKDWPRSLVNDILIAITCRENGFTLLTADEDFKMIRPHLRGFAHAPPWPADANSRRAIRAARVKPT
jgi:predicted nucleic acid-binding protein